MPLRSALEAIAPILETSPPLVEAIAALGDKSLLALRVAKELGGQELTPVEYWQVQEAIARKSCVLAFLQTQHQSATSFIASGENEVLKTQLPLLANGQKLVGVGFSHLRRNGPPCLTATPVEGGYRLNGTIPWATGWQIFQNLVAGATLDDGRSLIALIPFRSTEADSGSIHCSDPMLLSAFGESNTVSLDLKDWFVADTDVIDHKPVGWLQKADRRNVLKSTSLVMGCAGAALDLMSGIVHERKMTQAEDALQKLKNQVVDCRQEILAELTKDAAVGGVGVRETGGTYERQLALRGQAIALMGRCVQGAIALAGGAANSPEHPAQQLHRASVVFSVSGQSEKTAIAILAALSAQKEIA